MRGGGVEGREVSRAFLVASAGLAVAIFAIALTSRVPDGASLLDRVVPPALSDRRSFAIERASADDDGTIRLAGRLPGVRSVARMWWYVDGARAAVARERYDGNRFDVVLIAPPHRDRYTVFGYAWVEHRIVTMRDALLLGAAHRVATVPPAALAAQRSDPSVAARASVDQVRTGPVVRALENGVVELHESPQVTLVGWALDERAHAAAPRVEAVVDGRIAVAGPAGNDRPDVAAALHDPRYRRSGYSIELPSTAWTPGAHDVEIRVLQGARYGIGAHLTVRVSGP